MQNMNIDKLISEQRNPATMNLDDMSLHDFLVVMNEEDGKVAGSVKKVLPEIEKAVLQIRKALSKGRRLFYIGSGTSGRLGVLDAVECPPTFGTTDEVCGLIAGGSEAFVKAKEGAEDNEQEGMQQILDAQVQTGDVVVGIAASGRTPHTIGALKQAKEVGAFTIALSCNLHSEISAYADMAIEVNVGPEVISGSTRLKAGTAQKMILNMLSTAAMVGIGKTYQNLMVDLHPSNAKLIERSKRIIIEATGCTYAEAETAFLQSQQKVKTAIVMVLCGCSNEEAEERLTRANGFVKDAING